MRRRMKDRHLPACMYQKHGAYYLVRKNVWTRLGVDYQEALIAYAKAMDPKSQGGMPALIDKVLEHMTPRLAQNTIKQYQIAAAKLKETFAEFEPRQVLPKHVALLKMHMADTPNMCNRILSFLRVVFQHALEWQLVDSNPCVGIKRHAEKKRERYVSDEEFHRILAAAGPNMRVIYEMCYLTGQRISDVLAIRLADISPEGIAFKQQKTGARLVVRMTPDLQAVIDRAKALPRPVRGLTLFCTARGGKPVHYQTVKQMYQIACDRAGVADATLHDLRAKALTDTKRQGNDAQKLGGHTDAKMTARYIRNREIDVAEPPRMPTKGA